MQLENKKHDVLNFAEDPDILRQLQDRKFTFHSIVSKYFKHILYSQYSHQRGRNNVVQGSQME